MGLTQMSALGGGRRFKRPLAEEINARTSFLPQLYGIKKAEQHRKQDLGLKQRQLAQEKKFSLASLGLREEALHEAKKKNRYARNLGFANIGLAGGLGLYDALGQPSLSDVGDWFSFGDSAAEIGGVVAPSIAQNFGGITSGGDSGLFDYSDILELF